jgi:hypothetical protein
MSGLVGLLNFLIKCQSPVKFWFVGYKLLPPYQFVRVRDVLAGCEPFSKQAVISFSSHIFFVLLTLFALLKIKDFCTSIAIWASHIQPGSATLSGPHSRRCPTVPTTILLVSSNTCLVDLVDSRHDQTYPIISCAWPDVSHYFHSGCPIWCMK